MRRRLVLAWCCLVICSNLSGADIEVRSLIADRPVFRSVRVRPSTKNGSSGVRKTSGAFDLRLVVGSDDDLIKFVPPIIVNDQSDGLPALSEYPPVIEPPTSDESGQAKVLDSNVFDNQQAEKTFPASPSAPKHPSDQPIPIDGAPREKLDDDDKDPKGATERNSFAWIAGTENMLGMLEYDSEPLSRVRYDVLPATGATTFHLSNTWGARWLQGPVTTDLPPYLFNVLINVGLQQRISNTWTIDGMISPGWYTDFSNKGVEAFRLPWHVVSYRQLDNDWRMALGVADLSRQDIRWLPVFGFIYAPANGDVRWDLVFPRPRAAWRVCRKEKETHWVYIGGELGGGSWAISRSDRAYDTVTYRDYRLVAGYETNALKGHASRIEIGWIFGRAVEYRSGDGNYSPPDAFMLRLSSDY